MMKFIVLPLSAMRAEGTDPYSPCSKCILIGAHVILLQSRFITSHGDVIVASAPLLSEPSGARTPFGRKLDSLANGLNQTTFIGSSRSRYIERSAVIN